MKFTQTLLSAVILSTSLFTATATAALVPALGGQVVNDTDLNVTWLADANLAATNSFGLARNVDLGPIPGVNTYGGSYIYDFGTMTWGGALKWIAAMNASNYLGYSDWRLPATLQPDASCSYQYNAGAYGKQSAGYNCTGSEMGHLFYNELGGAAGQFIATIHNANYNLFSNLASNFYWSGTEYAPSTNYAWFFYFSSGYQNARYKDFNMHALAVRPGQVAAVPVPATAWLFGSGLLGLIGVTRKRKTA